MTKKARRTPKQTRAIERYNKILDSASELLAKPEAEKLSTTVIAEHAGFSVGSVYQFFPDVESIKVALIERLLDQYYENFIQSLFTRPDTIPEFSDIEDISLNMINFTYEFYNKYPNVVKTIVAYSQSEEFLKVNAELNEKLQEKLTKYFINNGFLQEESVIRRKIGVVLGISDLFTMYIWSTDDAKKQEAYLNDWRKLVVYYSTLDG